MSFLEIPSTILGKSFTFDLSNGEVFMLFGQEIACRTKKLALFSGLMLAMQTFAQDAAACVVNQSGPMPVCGGLTISPETDVVVILENQRTGGTTNILMGPDKNSAEYVNIVIGDVPRPVAIVVSHSSVAILNFSGNVDKVDQVIAMGARHLGWDHVATTGIDVAKFRFLPGIGHD